MSGSVADESEEDAGERIALGRLEAEALYQENLRKSRRTSSEPSLTEFDHMPAPIRPALHKLAQWTVNGDVHQRFSVFCRSDKNAKLQPVTAMFATEVNVSSTKYFEHMVKTKWAPQWKAIALAVGMADDAVTAVKGPLDSLRLLTLRFLFLAEAGDCITADLKDRSFFISPEAGGVSLFQ